MLPVSLDCPFLIAPSVFSNVYLFCLSSSCVPYIACFSGLSFLLFLLYSLTFIYQKVIRSKDVIISALARIPLVKHIRSFSLLYLYFFDIRILITPLVSSNSFCIYSLYFNLFKHIIIIEFKLKKARLTLNINTLIAIARLNSIYKAVFDIIYNIFSQCLGTNISENKLQIYLTLTC